MDILAQIIVYAIYAVLILAGLGFGVRICQFFYYRQYRSDSIKVYYDDNDHRKGYYIVKRPRGPYPVGYSKEQIVKNMDEFESLKKEETVKRKHQLDLSQVSHIAKEGMPTACNIRSMQKKFHPKWLQILLMTPTEYLEYKRQCKEQNRI